MGRLTSHIVIYPYFEVHVGTHCTWDACSDGVMDTYIGTVGTRDASYVYTYICTYAHTHTHTHTHIWYAT